MSASIIKTTSILFILRVVKMVLSMVTITLSVKFFGISLDKDIWILTLTLFTTLGLALWGPVNEVFRAKFVFIKEQQGEEKAIRDTGSLLGFIILVSLIVSILVLVFSHDIAAYMAANLPQNGIPLFVQMICILLPTFLITELTNIGISILNAYDEFYFPEYASIISVVLNVVILYFLAPVFGIYSLAISTYAGLAVLLAFVIVYMLKKEIHIWGCLYPIDFRSVKIFMLFALPFFFPYFVGQCTSLSGKWLAGILGEGNISILNYSQQFTSILQSVISSVLTTVMVPMLAKAYIQKELDRYEFVIKENIRICFLILCLALPIMIGAAVPLCKFFYLRGAVTMETIDIIARLVRFYSVAFVGVLAYIFTGMVLLSSDRGKQYAFAGVLSQIVTIVANCCLVPRYGLLIFPLISGISSMLSACYMCLNIRFQDRVSIFKMLLRYSVPVVALIGILYWINESVELESSVTQLLVNGTIWLLLFPFTAHILQFDLKKLLLKIKIKL